ncbi:MAG: type II toxin-antitoxin system RelE/ParE family toxin [Acidobacteria bacterium]|nr:type II toxin-antitoxin system RelE/ParE family toxin [Acidobacteriota bacterium]
MNPPTKVVFSPEAEEQLVWLFHYIAQRSSVGTSLRFTNGIVSHCENLSTFPFRGTKRDDIRPGLRVTHFKGRVVIAYVVESEQISILGVFYGGQDYEQIIGDSEQPNNT